MKVKELIEILNEMNPENEVRIQSDKMTVISHSIGNVQAIDLYGSPENPDGYVPIVHLEIKK